MLYREEYADIRDEVGMIAKDVGFGGGVVLIS